MGDLPDDVVVLIQLIGSLVLAAIMTSIVDRSEKLQKRKMLIKVGDTVSYRRSETQLRYPASWGVSFIHNIRNNGRDLRKGTVTDIKTHKYLYFKRKKPLYVVDHNFVTDKVKMVIRA